jgi:1,4-alpha-glucan branching enzyme
MKKLNRKKLIFEYFAPQARQVHVAGTFNEWNMESCPLKKDRSGKWKTQLVLPSGRYEYRYLVDGAWENDQRPVECVPNAFGSWNCVVTIP